jgi:DNA-binding transcriptional MerR regulator
VRIGEVAAKAGVSTRALRYYEEQRLLPAERSASGQRHYPEGAVDRVRLIQQFYAAGLGSKAVLELLPCMLTGIPTPQMLQRLVAERNRIGQRVDELTAARDRLDSLIVAGREAATAQAAGEAAA